MTTPTNDQPLQAPTGSNGPPPLRIRRPKVADPLVRPKRRPAVKPPIPTSAANSASRLPSSRPVTSNVLSGNRPERTGPAHPRHDFATNGFSGPLLSENYVDYPIVTTRRALREGLKHHIARFTSKKSVDPRDESQFTRPVRLQRRDPRARSHESHVERGQFNSKHGFEQSTQMDELEREELEARKAAREKERAENMAQIAPSVGSAPKRHNAPKQKTQQVAKTDMTPEEIARTRIKYEEALPWHLEDFDNKNIWVGNYEAALSETHAVFVLENTGRMRMIPVEKWYRFSAKNQFKALTIEEAERFMAKKVKDPRWFMEKQQELAQRKELEQFAKQQKVYAGKQGTPGGVEGLEGDEMDFEEDRFADDEEHDDLFNEDEEAKAAEKRIKKDQLKANVFDLKMEKDYEEEEIREKREKEARRVLGKKVRKALQKREKNFDYSSGSDANPYSDDESSDESDAERPKEEEEVKVEEDKSKKEPSKGNLTPSGRSRHTDLLKKGTATAPRKRLGSPSDASGTDTSRKKGKSKHPSSQPTPQPSSRPMSPNASSSLPVSKKRVRNMLGGGAGSISDVDGGAGSGGEMSESGKTKKLKLNPPSVASQSVTPQGSRAGSPVPLGSKSFSGSRASSPESLRGPTRISTPGPSSNTQSFPTPAEIHAAIPQSGILSSDLLKIFRPRIGESKENHRRFIAIVKDVGVYGKEDRLLRPGSLKGP
ncbi:transcription initiation factor IIF, alpha subunit [Aspergillus sclerotioniger CBS 115572]|uniref:Transcription initiation factor IIF subunit alpha n=1 Tax=Aspergillus sclerotioniger CBS 115572 TaxID=1450535 RepID=A0A317XDT5_9EURO|nr:transcription initiation factor IIF, alpha subunit [Aspergillus sclerotioniger CBS 115572]PWY96796.1 transcription initiation factor IIF, alpha subunit [Aspergillus sclerotioniger CBS 115572]